MHCFSLLGMKFDKNANELESKIAITKAESIYSTLSYSTEKLLLNVFLNGYCCWTKQN